MINEAIHTAVTISILISAIGWIGIVYMGYLVIRAHRKDPNYEMRSIVLFNVLFALTSITDLLMFFDTIEAIDWKVLTILFIIKAVFVIATIVSYYFDIRNFSKPKVDLDHHLEEMSEIKNNFYKEICSSKLSQDMKKELLSNDLLNGNK